MTSGEGSPQTSPRRLLAGAAIAACLVAALIVSLIGRGSPVNLGDSPVTPALPVPNPPTTEARAPVQQGSVETTVFHESDIRRVSREVLQAWGRLATTGSADLLRPLFHDLSPQLLLLDEEAGEISAMSLDGFSYVFTMEAPVIEASSPGFVTVTGSVQSTRSGKLVSITTWLLTLARSEDQAAWLVWTLEEVD